MEFLFHMQRKAGLKQTLNKEEIKLHQVGSVTCSVLLNINLHTAWWFKGMLTYMHVSLKMCQYDNIFNQINAF